MKILTNSHLKWVMCGMFYNLESLLSLQSIKNLCGEVLVLHLQSTTLLKMTLFKKCFLSFVIRLMAPCRKLHPAFQFTITVRTEKVM